jgi:electron-transferring-flavoprotein dehydrogenase
MNSVERDTLEVDVLIVGGGPAGLAAALRLTQLQREAGSGALTVAVLEKAREPGAHELSGAVLDPISLKELVPDFEERGAPLEAPVHEDRVYFLTEQHRVRFPITPPPLRNHGNYVISINRFTRWMATLVEAAGVDILAGIAATGILMEEGRVVGVRTGDRGIGRHGEPRATFEAGVDIRAKVTILAEGVRGSVTKELFRRTGLTAGSQPQVYAVGIKELWDVPSGRLPAGTVMHTMGYPLRFEEFGGAFVYAMPQGRISVGFVIGLDYRDPMFDPHVEFNRFKTHPLMKELLAGGQMIRYGAKALPEGGWYALPKCHTDGALIVGDAAGFVNAFRLKGLHLAIKTGMLAAETAFEAIAAGDVSDLRLSSFRQKVDASYVRRELYGVRNVRQSFEHGLLAGLAYSGFAVLTRGWWFRPLQGRAGHDRLATIEEYYGASDAVPAVASHAVKPDRTVTFDKVTNVHFSGTRHEEDQPPHLLVQTDVCHSICGAEYRHPCTRFCPANVYEMVPAEDGSGLRLQINASNCVHCKTCDIMDPYQAITWVPPEGGGGPQYDGM